MCSASTTLFNAALRSGLKIVERHAHSLYIDRYPVGLDATVYRSKSMVFVNDTDQPILIRGSAGKRWVTFEIYGVDDGRTVELSKPRITNRREGARWLEYSDNLRPGKRKRVQHRYDAFDVSVKRTVRDAQGRIIHRDKFTSRHRSLDGLVRVGRYPEDPLAGTRIPASEYPHRR
jgi:vancomycin resistance protein YoaR